MTGILLKDVPMSASWRKPNDDGGFSKRKNSLLTFHRHVQRTVKHLDLLLKRVVCTDCAEVCEGHGHYMK